jgi:hypothetical protein
MRARRQERERSGECGAAREVKDGRASPDCSDEKRNQMEDDEGEIPWFLSVVCDVCSSHRLFVDLV